LHNTFGRDIVSSGSVNTEKHAGGHSSEFLSQVRTLKAAETAAASSIEDAKAQALQVEAAAREEAVKILSKAKEKAVEAKNEIFSKSRAETEAECGSLISDARKKAEKIRASRLSDSDVSGMAQGLL